ncbi:helix-turn-helix domain-containing protein [Streptomyces nojiriensis]
MSTTRSTAAGKVLEVLSAFDREHPSQTLSEIAQRTGLALSTTHRVVAELADWGRWSAPRTGRGTSG